METIEKQLTDYKDFQIWKVTDNKGLKSETITYISYDQDDNLFDAKQSLKELKQSIDNYVK